MLLFTQEQGKVKATLLMINHEGVLREPSHIGAFNDGCELDVSHLELICDRDFNRPQFVMESSSGDQPPVARHFCFARAINITGVHSSQTDLVQQYTLVSSIVDLERDPNLMMRLSPPVSRQTRLIIRDSEPASRTTVAVLSCIPDCRTCKYHGY